MYDQEHSHVLLLLGACAEQSCLVYEYMDKAKGVPDKARDYVAKI